jgi:uncharacterized protein (DUF1778 family)
MKNKLKSVRRHSKSAATSQPKTAKSESALPPGKALNKSTEPSPTIRGKKSAGAPRKFPVTKLSNTWSIVSNATQSLHRTLDGQLILVDQTQPDLSGSVHHSNARLVSYSEACSWLKSSGCNRKPEVVLQFHGIMRPPALQGGIPPSTTVAELCFIRGAIHVKLDDDAGNEIATLKIDEDDAELLQKAAAASELKLTEFLRFIVLRQLEAFFPPDVKGLYRVSDNTVEEISSGLDAVEKNSTALGAVSDLLVSGMQYVPSSWSLAELRSEVSRWKGLCQAVHELSSRVHGAACDTHTHWQIAGRPALLEYHPVQVSTRRTQAAA